MIAATVISLILLILSLCQGSCGLRPLIRPNVSEVLINAGDSINFECIHSSRVFFFFPAYSQEYGQKVVSSQLQTGEFEGNGRYKYGFFRRNAKPTETGWYGCADHNVTITPEVYNDPEVSWIYFYVTSPNKSFIEEGELKTIRAVAGSDAILPCRPTSPDLRVLLFNEDTGEEIEVGENISYDPKFGFKISHVSVRDSGFFRCLITQDGIEYETSYHLRVQRNTTLKDPIINDNDLENVIRGQNLHVDCTIELEAGTPYLFNWSTSHESPRIRTYPYIIETGPNSQRVINELIIDNVREEDEGEYECFIRTYEGVRSKKVYLKICGDGHSKL